MHILEIFYIQCGGMPVKNIKTLKRLGVRMFVGEFWYVNNEDWQDVVKDAGVFLRDKLDKGFE